MELSRRALAWCEQVATRVCASTGVAAAARLSEERQRLGALPAIDFDCRAVETRRVLREAVVAYERNHYSVPAHLVGQHVTLKPDFDGTLHIFADAEEVAVHAALRHTAFNVR